jgi:hypothetical protein
VLSQARIANCAHGENPSLSAPLRLCDYGRRLG